MTTERIAYTAIRAKGDWNGATEYPELSLVRHDGALYVATRASTGVEPPNTLFWALCAKDGDEITSVTVGEARILTDGYTATPVTITTQSGFEATFDVLAKSGNDDVAFIETTATLYADAWQGDSTPYSQTISVPEVTADGINFISAPKNSTPAELSVLYGANLQDGGQRDGEITVLCFGDVPANDVDISIAIFNN